QPWTRILVRRQRHRREHRRAMTFDARVVEDWGDVLGERRCALGCHRRQCRGQSRDDEDDRSERETHGRLQKLAAELRRNPQSQWASASSVDSAGNPERADYRQTGSNTEGNRLAAIRWKARDVKKLSDSSKRGGCPRRSGRRNPLVGAMRKSAL